MRSFVSLGITETKMWGRGLVESSLRSAHDAMTACKARQVQASGARRREDGSPQGQDDRVAEGLIHDSRARSDQVNNRERSRICRSLVKTSSIVPVTLDTLTTTPSEVHAPVGLSGKAL